MKQKILEIYEPLKRLIPWVSFGWGIISAFFISRNLSNPTPFLVAGMGFIALTLIIQGVLAKLNIAELPSSEDEVPAYPADERKLQRQNKVRSIAQAGVALAGQNAVQYTLAFVTPILFVAGQWIALALSFPLAIISLWDPWWFKFHAKPTFLLWARLWTLGLVVSFFCTSVLPGGLFVFFPLLALAFVGASGLWKWKRQKETASRKETLWQRLAITVCFVLACVGQWYTQTSYPFPAVGVWIRNGSFTFSKPTFEEREKVVNSLEELNVSQWPFKEPLCCVSPIVAGNRFKADVRHRWILNDKTIDTIALNTASGNGEEASFRTYSCKRNFPELKSGDSLTCVVVASGRVELGRMSIDAK